MVLVASLLDRLDKAPVVIIVILSVLLGALGATTWRCNWNAVGALGTWAAVGVGAYGLERWETRRRRTRQADVADAALSMAIELHGNLRPHFVRTMRMTPDDWKLHAGHVWGDFHDANLEARAARVRLAIRAALRDAKKKNAFALWDHYESARTGILIMMQADLTDEMRAAFAMSHGHAHVAEVDQELAHAEEYFSSYALPDLALVT